MLYTVANEGWAPGFPLRASEARSGLYRTRREAVAIAPGRRLLAVAVRYDEGRGLVAPTWPAARELPGGWSAPAAVGPSGELTTPGPIPAPLVRVVDPVRIRAHSGHPGPAGPHRPIRHPRNTPG